MCRLYFVREREPGIELQWFSRNEQQLFTKLFLGKKDFRFEIREKICFSSFKQNKAAKEDKDCSLTAKENDDTATQVSSF